MSIELDSILEIGIEAIDSQHRELHRRIGRVLHAMSERKGRTEIGPMIDFLVQYTVEHFATEEALMVERNYPGYAAHRAEHERFVADFAALRQEYDTAGPSSYLVIRFSGWLAGWLRDHLYRVDKQMADFVKSSAGIV